MRACRSKPIPCRLYSSIRSLVGVTGRVERATDGRHEAQGPISKRIGLEHANRKADDWWKKQKNVWQIRRSGASVGRTSAVASRRDCLPSGGSTMRADASDGQFNWDSSVFDR